MAGVSRHVAKFHSNEAAKAGYYDWFRTVVGRINSVTGVPYAEDPAILAWQHANEPRPGGTDAATVAALPHYYEWIDTTGALIREIDLNHLVSLGHEGTQGAGGREDVVMRAHREVDYMTAHIWPLNWGWVHGKNLEGTWPAGKTKVEDYLAMHVRLARGAGKPLTIEEFGVPRDGVLYDPQALDTFRRRYYRTIYDAAEASLARGGPVQGTNSWAWTGEARAQHADHRFRDGDYMGDPPHEPQGWYGVFDSDEPMLTVIAGHAQSFATP